MSVVIKGSLARIPDSVVEGKEIFMDEIFSELVEGAAVVEEDTDRDLERDRGRW